MSTTKESNVFTLADCPHLPDNPNFSAERAKDRAYTDSLQAQVDELRRRDPAKYQKYQEIGDSLMSCSYDLTPGVDLEGDRLEGNRLLYTARDLGVDDLSPLEITLLVSVYGVNWMSLLKSL